MSRTDDVLMNNSVGPVMRSGEIADAVVEAAEMDNPGKEIKVEDMHAYIRISTDSEMVLSRETIEECLGRPFRMQELEVNLSSFAGKIESGTERFRFYFTSKL